VSRGLDSGRALRAVSVRGTESSTAAAAEVLLSGGRIVATRGSADGAPADGGGASVNSALLVEVAAVADAEGDVEDAAEDPEGAEDETPVADSAEDKKASEGVDNTTAERRHHTGEGSEHGGGLELEADEEEGEDHEVGGEHTDGEVGSVVVELHTALKGVGERLIVGVGVGGDQREDAVDEQDAGKDEGHDAKDQAENAASLGLAAANAPLFNKHVRCCTRHTTVLPS